MKEHTTARYPRITPNILIGTEERVFKLALPPCQNCQTPRDNEHAKFCSHCGVILKTASTFDEIVKHDIEKLGLTKKRVQTIKKHSHISIIKDILMDHEKLRDVPGIGEIWAKRIHSRAEEYIS
ncbi:hypothetical protein PN36_21885 [Candidatus Thiomargarita nelsonii]|uniref:Uncharacterized protein n=1 Tax=Candidatus Thiomargarita nelsonii TaxID=1003181 RepID=A0A0A6PDK7_9GAMM|nr:hypothetical protein PN36_21885 [Candidatus Thiomargarita nelsonii]